MAAAAIQPNVKGPVHAVGMYIGGASALLLLCFLADFLQGIRKRKFWLPCAWTTANALTLSVLAIAIKLPNDISTPMMGGADQLSKLSGTVLTCTFMAVTLPSMGNVVSPGQKLHEEGAVTSMELRANLAGLGVLVVTMVVNVCTQLRTGLISSFRVEHMVVLVATLLCFGYLCSAALAASAFPLGSLYPFPIIDQPGSSGWTRDKPRYLMVARTSSKQYVVSRSSIGCVVGALTSVSLAMLIIAMARTKMAEYVTKSDYEWTIWPILVFQILAILMGWIAICVRWWRPIIFQEQERISLKSSYCQAIEPFWKMTLLKYRLKQGTRKKQLRGLLFVRLQATTIDILLGWQIASVRISKVVLTCCQWLCYCVSVKYMEEKWDHDILQVYALPGERPLGVWYSNVSQLDQKLHELSSEGLDITNLCKLLAHAKGNPPTFKSIQVVLKYALSSYSWSLTTTSLLTIMKSLEDFYKEVNDKEYCDVEIAFNGLTQASNMIKLIEDMAVDQTFGLEKREGNQRREAAEDVVAGLHFGEFLDFPLNLLHDHARWLPWIGGQLQLVTELVYGVRIPGENTELPDWCAIPEGHFNSAMIILQRLRVTADIKRRFHSLTADMGAYFAWKHLFEVSKAITDLQEEQKIEGFKDLESATNPNEFDDDQWLLLAIIKTTLADVVGACLTNVPGAVSGAVAKGSYNHVESVCIEAIRVGDTWCKLWEQLHWPLVKAFLSKNFDLREWLEGQPIDPFIRDDASTPLLFSCLL